MGFTGTLQAGLSFKVPGMSAGVWMSGAIDLETRAGQPCEGLAAAKPWLDEQCGHYRLIKAFIVNCPAPPGAFKRP
jgi:hypothetical protein